MLRIVTLLTFAAAIVLVLRRRPKRLPAPLQSPSPPPASHPDPSPHRPLRRSIKIRAVAAIAALAFLMGTLAFMASGVLATTEDVASRAVSAEPTTAPAIVAAPTEERAPTEESSQPPEWRLFAGGDVLLDLSEQAGRDPFAGISPSLATADLVVVNVEMAIASGGTAELKRFVFLAPPSAARTMAAAGIDAGNLGNNHTLDYGVDALLETIQNLRSAGVAPVGAGTNEAEAYAPASFEIVDVRVAIIGASRIYPEPSWAADDEPGLASAYAESRLLEAVRTAGATHDVVIVMVHWGVQYEPCPNDDQLRLGAALLEAGAAVVLGTHPHVLQPIVLQNDGLIAYSLGNFAWRPQIGVRGETGLLEVRFQGANVSGFAFYPHVLDSVGAPLPAPSPAAERIVSAIGADCTADESILAS